MAKFVKLQPASCVLKNAVIPIDQIYVGQHDEGIDEKYIGFRYGEVESIRVRRPVLRELQIISSTLHCTLLAAKEKWIIVHGQELYERFKHYKIAFVITEIWGLDQ